MEFKGTKGRWTVKNGQICSSVYCGDEQIALKGRSTQEARANMVLIAHAPEMLEMLQMWCMDMEEMGRAYGDCYTMTKELIKSATEL